MVEVNRPRGNLDWHMEMAKEVDLGSQVVETALKVIDLQDGC